MFYTNVKRIPLHSLVIMVGPAKSGKSSLCTSKFSQYERVDPEIIKEELIGGDSKNDYNQLVWSEVHRRVALKLSLGERVVVDSSNLKKHNRVSIANTALRWGIPVFYVVTNRPLADKLHLATGYSDKYLIEKHEELFRDAEKEILRGDGVAEVIDARSQDFGVIEKFPYADIGYAIKNRGYAGVTAIGDLHGCLEAMKQSLDWARSRNHLAVLLGDIIDYGPNSLECIDEAYKLLTRGQGIMVIGNHERKIEKWLEQIRQGKIKIKLSEGNKITTTAIENLSPDMREKFEVRFRTVMNLSRHHWVAGNTLFTHGAADPEMFNVHTSRLFGRFENLALFGEIDDSLPFRDNGYPNRTYGWIDHIPSGKNVVVGHDIRSHTKPYIHNGKTGGQAIFMDCGSGKGGSSFAVDMVFSDDGLKIQSFIKN